MSDVKPAGPTRAVTPPPPPPEPVGATGGMSADKAIEVVVSSPTRPQDGPQVKALQHALNALGAKLRPDGKFGKKTDDARLAVLTGDLVPKAPVTPPAPSATTAPRVATTAALQPPTARGASTQPPLLPDGYRPPEPMVPDPETKP